LKRVDLCLPGALAGCIGSDKKPLNGLRDNSLSDPRSVETTVDSHRWEERYTGLLMKPLRNWGKKRRIDGRIERWFNFSLEGSTEVKGWRIS